jgi:hypothetical protein
MPGVRVEPVDPRPGQAKVTGEVIELRILRHDHADEDAATGELTGERDAVGLHPAELGRLHDEKHARGVLAGRWPPPLHRHGEIVLEVRRRPVEPWSTGGPLNRESTGPPENRCSSQGVCDVAQGTAATSRITVVIPTHNRRELLREAIEAVLKSSALVRPQDILVVDDASSDHPEEVARELGTRYHRVRLGEPGRVRNAGLALVDTEYVMFLDDDDLVLPGHPDRLIEALDTRPDAGFVFGQAQAFEGDHVPFGALFPDAATMEDDPRRNALLHRAQLGTVVFRTAAVRAAGGFNEALRYFEDCDLQMRVVCRQPSIFVPFHALRYRVHPASVMGSRSAERYLADLRTATRAWQQLGVPRELLRLHARDQRGRASFDACYAASQLAKHGQRRQSIRSLLQGIRLSPLHALAGHRTAWKAVAAIARPSHG